MWRKETIKNKIYALVLIGIGALSIFTGKRCHCFYILLPNRSTFVLR